MATSDKYKFDLTLELGNPMKVAASYPDPQNPAVVAGKNCAFNPTTDAVVLGNIGAVAKTAGFQTPLSFRLVVLGGAVGDGRIAYEGQTVCTDSDSEGDLSTSFKGNWSGSGTLFDQGQQTSKASGSFLILLKDYFSPAYPTGNEQWARALSVHAAPTSSQYGTASVFNPTPSSAGFSTAGLTLG